MPTNRLERSEAKPPPLRLPVIAEGAERLAVGNLMRRNILTCKLPPLNEGYDPIRIHPSPRRRPTKHEHARLRVQAKSRYASDAMRGLPINKQSTNACYTLPRRLTRRWHDDGTTW